MVRQEKLGDVLELSYLRSILNETSEILSNQKDLKRLQSQPRISIDSWVVTKFDELVPLVSPEPIEKTQTQLSFTVSNVGKGNAYNLRSCLYAKPIDDLSSPPIEEIREELFAAEATSKLRREGREPERDPKNHLESSESANFLSNTFVYINGRKRNAFGVDTTGPFPPGTTPPDGFAVGIKLMYEDELEEAHEKIIFTAIGGIPKESLQDFFNRIKGIVNFDEFETIFPEEIQFS